MDDFSHIVVPVDGSEGSLRAARFAAGIGAALGIPVKLAYVITLTPEAVMGLSRLGKTEVEEMHRRQVSAVLEQAREAMGDLGRDAAEVVMSGDPAEEILGYVDRNPDVLVVMGRRGLSPVQSLMLGSVSEKVLRSANGVVTLVN